MDVLTGLDELADQSLLRRLPDYDEPRLLMLQVIREYAFEMLQASGEEKEIRDRHAAALQALAESVAPRLFGVDQKKWLDRLELDHDNFRAAFDWAMARGDAQRALCLGAAIWRFWQMRGHLREGRLRLDDALTMPGARDDPAIRGRALDAAGGVAYWQGDLDAAQVYYDECLELARVMRDPQGLANALYNASFPSNLRGLNIPKVSALLEEALDIFRGLGDDSGVARCLWGLGQANYRVQKYDEAVVVMDQAITLFRGLGDQFGLGWALFLRASLAIHLKDTAVASRLDQEALRIFAKAEDISGAVLILTSLAGVSRLDGDLARAARLAGASEAQEAASGAGLGSVLGSSEGWRPTGRLSDMEEAARAEGKAMTLEQAIEYALAEDSPSEAAASS
jgi:tetratricopeptide (TPR) repeat protein